MRVRNYTEVRDTLKSCIDEVQDSREPLLITRQRGGNAILVAEEEWNSIVETLHVLGTRENTEILMRSLRQLDEGNVVEYDLAVRTAAE